MNLISKLGGVFAKALDNLDVRHALRTDPLALRCKGVVTLEHFRRGELIYTETGPNTFTTEGMAKLLNIMWYNHAKISNWYIGIFKGNITPAVGDTASAKLGSGGGYTACQDADYSSPATNHASYTTVQTATAVMTNSAAKASFGIVASITVYGAYLTDIQAKTGTSGVLMAAKRFAASRNVVNGDTIDVQYDINVTTS